MEQNDEEKVDTDVLIDIKPSLYDSPMREEFKARLSVAEISTSSSEDNPNRKELLWTSRQESLINEWKLDAATNALAHEKKAKFLRKLHRIFGTAAVITPIISTMIVNLYPTNMYISSSGLMTCSLFSAIVALFGFSEQSGDNFEAANKYTSLVNDIRSELVKPRSARIACDLFICRVELSLQQLALTSPHL